MVPFAATPGAFPVTASRAARAEPPARTARRISPSAERNAGSDGGADVDADADEDARSSFRFRDASPVVVPSSDATTTARRRRSLRPRDIIARAGANAAGARIAEDIYARLSRARSIIRPSRPASRRGGFSRRGADVNGAVR